MLNLQTLVLATFVCAISFAIAMQLLRRALPGEPGLRFWAGGALALCLGIYFQSMRGHWTPWISVMGGNALISAGAVWCTQGAMAMASHAARWHWGAMAGGLMYAGIALMRLTEHPVYAGLMLQSAFLAVALAKMAWTFWHFPNPRMRRTARMTALLVAAGFGLFASRMWVARPENVALPEVAYQSLEFVLPYAYAMLYFNWMSIVISVLAADQLLEQLRVALKKAEESDRVKSAFIASITHEWRTPLNAISGFSQLLSQDGKAPTEVRESAELIHHAGEHLLNVVNDLVDLRLLQEGTMEFQFSLCHVQHQVDQAVAAERSLARKSGITLISSGAAANATIWVDAQRLRQVLSNLISNAIRFNRPGGQVQVIWELDGHNAIVRICDTGTGIPANMHHRLFKAFDRLGAESGQVQGTGIGLAIAQQLVQRMGGTIGFQSQPGIGSEFWICFPMAERVKGEVVLQTATGPKSHEDQSTLPNKPTEPAIPQSKRVLYIEDHPTNQKLVQAVFQKQLGIAVDLAMTAEEGLASARAAPPGLILLDINLPGMDGYQALKALRADPVTERIPVMALTAQTQPEDVARGRHAGFDAYLTKPLNLGSLISTAMQLLRKS